MKLYEPSHLILFAAALFGIVAATVAASLSIVSPPDYFDQLRVNVSAAQDSSSLVISDTNSSIYQVILLDSASTTAYRLAEIKSFIPFSDGLVAIPTNMNEAFAVLLAMYHFNTRQERDHHPVLPDADSDLLRTCNVKLTVEFFDSQLSPAKTTQSFTTIMQRRTSASIAQPLPTAVVGAQRSSETLPLAVLTGVKLIPHLTGSATSISFDDKEQFANFGRTVCSSKGEGAAAVRFFQSIGSTHVAILFLTDAYGSALQKSFRDEANKVGIVSDSIPFDKTATASDFASAMASLKRSQFKHVYAITFEDKFASILTAASETGAIGSDYLYLFCGLTGTTLFEQLQVKHGSPLALAMQGTGLITMEGTPHAESIVQGIATKHEFHDDSQHSADRFGVAWRDALLDPGFVSYATSKIPAEFRSGLFDEEPFGYASFNYDAVTALGLAMCRAGENTTFFSGPEIYAQYRRLDFQGASGRVRILPESGSRDFTSMTFIVWNLRTTTADPNGNAVMEYVPSYQLVDGNWSVIPGNEFSFADGTTVAPESLPPVPFNFNYIGNATRAVGYSLMGVVMISALACLVWTMFHLHSRAVDSAHPVFLIMVATGAFTMALAIFPLALEETVIASEQTLSTACMAVPWLYFVGTGIALSALLAKTHAAHKAYMDPSIDEIQIASTDILRFGIALISLNVVLISIWYLVSPMEWTRVQSGETDSFNRSTGSNASCKSDGSLGFAASVIGTNLCFLLVGTVWSYRTRNIATENNESRYIGICISAICQAWLMGMPVLVVSRRYPSASFFVQCGLIVTTSSLALILVFVPKMLVVHEKRIEEFNPRELYRNWKRFVYTSENPEPTDEPTIREPTGRAMVASTTAQTDSTQESLAPAAPPSPTCPLSPGSVKIVHNPRSPRNLEMTGGVELSYGQLRKLQVQMLGESEVDDDKASADENIDEKALEAAAAARMALTSLGTVWTISENSRLERDDSRLDSAAFSRKGSVSFSRENPS